MKTACVFFKGWLTCLLIAGAAGLGLGCGKTEGVRYSDDPFNKPPFISDCTWKETTTKCGTVNESSLLTMVSNGVVSVSLPTSPPGSKDVEATLRVELLDESGKSLGSASEEVEIASQGESVLKIDISGIPKNVEPGDLVNYVLDYRVICKAGETTGRRSLFPATEFSQVVVNGSDELMSGATNSLRLFVQNPHTGQPLAETSARLFLDWKEGDDEKTDTLSSGKTDDLGMVEFSFDLPSAATRNAHLRIEVDDQLGVQTLSAPVQIVNPQSILLTTDKPLYQPGQTIHLRALALRRPDLDPEAEADALFEVLDSKGNKVFKQSQKTSAFGVASATFSLASEVLLGPYTVKVTVGDSTQEKTVTVDRYSLPKFNIKLETEKRFYAPGEKLTGSVNTQYFFGKPVAGASVEIAALKYDIEFDTFQIVDGKTDSEGLFDFQIDLPTYFVGQPLDQGSAFVLLRVTVTDTAGQSRTIETTRPVVTSSIISQVVPESGNVVPGVANRFYLLTTDPLGIPVATTNEIKRGFNTVLEVETGPTGIAVFELIPPASGSMTLSVTTVDEQNQTSKRSFTFSSDTLDAFVLLRTDKPIYAVGETATVTVHCPQYEHAATAFKDRVYLDIVKDGRTALMTTVELDKGVGSTEITITPELTGGFELEAYYLSQDSQILRDRKLAYADPADGLHIAVSQDQSVYAPAEQAKLTFTVTDDEGLPAQAAIGLQIVDEAVFALMEFKPGLEKVFYAIEDEVMSPRYEIHGYEMNDVTNASDTYDPETRDDAAGLLFASAGGSSFGISEDSYNRAQQSAASNAKKMMEASVALVVEKISALCDSGDLVSAEDIEKYLRANDACWADPWGQLYKITSSYMEVTFASFGPDELQGTADDHAITHYLSACQEDFWEAGGGMDGDTDSDGDVDWDMDDEPSDNGGGEDGDGDAAGPRVRRHFPETLLVVPELITDEGGKASLSVPLADSITTWRLTGLASSTNGRLGSTQHGITVFQDFFVDIDFPPTLTQDDEIAVPIAVYNYLDESQTVTLTAEEAPWFDLLDLASKDIVLGPGEVLGTSFLIRVREVGKHAFTVFGYGDVLSDAVERSVMVVPNGKEIAESQSGSLKDIVEHVAVIPDTAIEGASKIMVKIYPGMVSQAVEGLDSMLSMPSGCFEQTSSATYPNVLVLDYMMSTQQITPEIELKARTYVNHGYQRLLTYEVDGGGFEWFGNTPAHNILTAYGLLEFYDMSRVHPVDPAIISRTQEWLAAQQKADGHFEPTYGGIAEGAINAYQDDVARTTAYLTYALVETGYAGPETNRGIAWVKENADAVEDSYGLAMVANALVAANPDDPKAQSVLARLHDLRIEDDDGAIHWKGEGESTTYGSGDVIELETTALVGYAFLRAGAYPEDVTGALQFLLSKKDSLGNWSTTQATILTLRLMLAVATQSGNPGPATVRVYSDDVLFETLDISAENSDVLRLVDLGTVTHVGNNSIRIEFEGDSGYMYQIITRYYEPWGVAGGVPEQGQLDIAVEYDKTTLAVDDIVKAKVTVSNKVPDTIAKMVLIDIGFPPGFDLMTDDLEAALEAKTLQRYEKTPRQLILYVEGISYGAPFVAEYGLRAKYPLVASSGEVEAHPYYEPSDSTQAEPVEFTVNE